MKPYLKLLRVKHYAKNVLIFFPLFFSGQMGNPHLLLQTALGTVSFCLASSFVYILNDIRDVGNDRAHPTKRDRPIASGAVPVRQATAIGVLLLVFAALLNVTWPCDVCALGHKYLYLAIYIVINCLYSLGCKNIPVLDVALLSAGYPIRVLFGGLLAEAPVSSWLFLTVLCISLYLGLGKRHGELSRLGGEKLEAPLGTTRPVLAKYTLSYLDGEMYLCLGLGLVFYSLWALEKSMALVYTLPLVLLICMTYNFLLAGRTEGDPVNVVFSSKALMGLIAVYGVAISLILYL